MAMPVVAKQWSQREQQFAPFLATTLPDFWRLRQENEFIGVDQVPIRYVRFTHSDHRRVIVIIPGRIECYLKYQELAFDLFHCGYDILLIDHRGQGFSGRMLADRERGHVEYFADYVTDLETFWHSVVKPLAYPQVYALAHSMGGTIVSLFLSRQPLAVNAVVLSAPMTGIQLPLPYQWVKGITHWAEKYPRIRNYYVPGGSKWRALSFQRNTLTHSSVRYQYYQRLYTQTPMIRVGSPTYHWLGQALQASEQMLACAKDISTPLLCLQASEDKVVDNPSQVAFCQALAQASAGYCRDKPHVMQGARHEIFFESDAIRTDALHLALDFFSQHS